MFKIIKDFFKENIIFIIIMVVCLFSIIFDIPYDIEMPGGCINLADRIIVNDETYTIDGSFNMTYVSVSRKLFHLIGSYFIKDWDAIPINDNKLENETVKESDDRSKLLLEQSKNNAIVAALDAAKLKYTLNNQKSNVAYIGEKARTDLKIGDVLLSCDGKELKKDDDITECINKHQENDEVKLHVKRKKDEKDVTAKIYVEDNEKFIGISIVNTFDVSSSINVSILSKGAESGPSGGMMMALMTYSAITSENLTKGHKIAGTGTINKDGTVGAIGGVKYKIIGAVKDKVDVFLIAKDNYEEALKVKEEKGYDIEIVSVSTLNEAINYLKNRK